MDQRVLLPPELRSADFQSAVSQGFQPAELGKIAMRERVPGTADWKSAIQQIGNLRYEVQGEGDQHSRAQVVRARRAPSP